MTSAPTGFGCDFVTVSTTNDAIRCSWDPLLGATKYSVDGITNFDLAGGGSQSADFDFSVLAPDTTVTTPLSSFPTDINGDTVADTLVSVVLRVKGLAPRGKRGFNEHNASSGTVTCVVSTATPGADAKIRTPR